MTAAYPLPPETLLQIAQRRTFSALGAVAATFALFYAMQSLAGLDTLSDYNDGPARTFVTYIEEAPVMEPELITDRLKKPEMVPEPDIIDDLQIDRKSTTDTPISFTPTGPTTKEPALGPIFGPQRDGDFLPLVRVQATYPRRAIERGVEGYAVVSLTVEPDGSVDPSSVQILEAEPTGYFEKAAKKAAAKFKYKPRVVDGVPQTVTGVTYRFSFTLDQ